MAIPGLLAQIPGHRGAERAGHCRSVTGSDGIWNLYLGLQKAAKEFQLGSSDRFLKGLRIAACLSSLLPWGS